MVIGIKRERWLELRLSLNRTLSLQQKFIDNFEQVQFIQSQQTIAVKKAEETFDVLLAKLFQ